MKKFLAALLCALMLLSAMIPAAVAEDMVTVNLYIPTLAPSTEDAIRRSRPPSTSTSPRTTASRSS